MAKEQYLTVKAMARELGRNESEVYYWIRIGKLATKRRGITPNSQHMIPMSEVERIRALITSGKLIE